MGKPEEFSTLTSTIIAKDAQATIDAYENALGAEICGVMKCPQTGKVAHACLKIGESSLFVSDEFPEMNVNATGRQEFYLYVDNADNAFNKAKNAGFTAAGDPEDMFWGDRVGTLQDPNGNSWKLAQKVRDVSPEEMEEMMKNMPSAA